MGQLSFSKRFVGLAAVFVLALGFLLVIPATSRAASLTVCASGCDHTTIQAAIDAASAGDTIDIADETFAE